MTKHKPSLRISSPYLQDSLANIEVIIGDGRVSLIKELKETGTQAFDVLVIDAFSGDAIPVHLLTAEVMNLYHSHLKEDGIIAFHVTNIHINLFDVWYGTLRNSKI